ncbi:UDP-glycosyltransferase 87A1, partial [Mucuna pruriens]
MADPIQVPPTIAGHVVAIPYPGRGHVNPMMNLCKLLLSKSSDILVTFVVTEEWLGFIASNPKPANIRFASIPNVIPSEQGRANDFLGFLEAVMTKMEAPFEQLLDRFDPPPTVVIYDAYLSWVVRIANSRNIPVASFWPMSASFFSVLKNYHLLEQNGHYPVNLSEEGEKRVDYIPGNSSIRLADFPLSDESLRSRRLLELALTNVPWVEKAQYLLFSSIYELEPRAIDALKAEISIPIYTVGPAIPYFGNGHIDASNNDYYFEWLDKQPPGSVLYISQGSFLSVSKAQMDEIAAGVRESGVGFLWVQPGESGRLREMCGDRGLVLGWCEQFRVLQHHAVGGFWSHCGWNSTKEGVFSGAPFLAFPIFMDQPLNGKLIVEDWRVGWRVRREVKEGTLITKDEIANVIKKFMDVDGDEARDMRKRSRELKQICQSAIASGGSSETNTIAFLSRLLPGAKPE